MWAELGKVQANFHLGHPKFVEIKARILKDMKLGMGHVYRNYIYISNK